ncbi:hypothetical protein MP638_001644 [Amoeboaphelidium occidentale]|nr:hypothetical protein MP638_001644 [Amoeboaphelidium occidentale]
MPHSAVSEEGQAKLAAFRNQKIKDFIPMTNLAEQKLIEVNDKTAIEDVLAILARHNILSLPVVATGEKKKTYSAIANVYDLLDFVLFAACDELEQSPDKLTHSAFTLKHPISDILEGHDQRKESYKLWMYSVETKLDSVLEVLSKGVHRCLLEEGPYLLTQFDIIKAIHANPSILPVDMLNSSMQALGLFPSKCYGKRKEVVSIPNSYTALRAFKRMVIDDVSGLPVVDNKNQFCNVITSSDLRGIEVLTLPDLLLSIEKFLDKRSPHRKHHSFLTITPETTLNDAIVKFVDGKVHHLWYLDDKKRPIGVTTLTDVITKFSSTDYL